MRLYGKPISKGDIVQVLPERGKKENADSKASWCVTTISGGDAHLVSEDGTEERDVKRSDLVAVTDYDQPIYAGLRETGRVERGGDKPHHVVINGENYHALEALTFAYAGKVDCIYIDPPYNTGARDWKYNNDYVGGDDAYRHSKWLAMMERRLKLAKQLLNPEDSVLIATIDEKEYLRLGLLLEQVFAGCSIQMVSDVINPKGVARTGQFSRSEEYIFFVQLGSASPSATTDNMLDQEAKGKTSSKVPWLSMLRRGSHSSREERENLFYPIFVDELNAVIVGAGDPPGPGISREMTEPPFGSTALWPLHTDGSEACWQLGKATFLAALDAGTAKLGRKDKKSGQWAINYLNKGLLDEIADGRIEITGKDAKGALLLARSQEKLVSGKSVWFRARHDASTYGTGVIRALLPGRSFAYPKSLYAVEDALRFYVGEKPDALVLDFFSGSGTTAHAVMRLNHQDGGRRRSISVTNNEVSEDEAKKLTKKGLRQGDPEWEALGICQYVTKPRVEAAITGRTPEGEPIKGDYKFTDEFPMSDGMEENAVFFDLTYQNPALVSLGGAFEEIAPLLWMRAGCRGEIIRHEERGFALAEAYAVLFDYARARDFVAAVKAHPSIRTVFVVTDDESRCSNIKAQLPDLDVCRLYESYLRSFRIAAEGAAI
ncbi:MAG: site-specific DNA-methyltransferase [Collinsella sp.]